MKKVLLVGLLAISVLPASADLKIALVDTGKAFDAYYKTKETATRIAAKEAGYKKEVQDLQVEDDRLRQEAQSLETSAKDVSLPEAARRSDDAALALKVQDIQTLDAEITHVQKDRTQDLRDELVRSHKEISEGIMRIITTYVGAQGYDLVLDISIVSETKGLSAIQFNSPKIVDITPEIIARLNATAPLVNTP
jgi:Skp family chaperone for outer membrane proteins